MIKINGNNIIGVYIQQTPIIAVYINRQLVWSKRKPTPSGGDDIIEIYSCFARGYWVDSDPWTDDTPWTD